MLDSNSLNQEKLKATNWLLNQSPNFGLKASWGTDGRTPVYQIYIFSDRKIRNLLKYVVYVVCLHDPTNTESSNN